MVTHRLYSVRSQRLRKASIGRERITQPLILRFLFINLKLLVMTKREKEKNFPRVGKNAIICYQALACTVLAMRYYKIHQRK